VWQNSDGTKETKSGQWSKSREGICEITLPDITCRKNKKQGISQFAKRGKSTSWGESVIVKGQKKHVGGTI